MAGWKLWVQIGNMQKINALRKVVATQTFCFISPGEMIQFD